MCRFIVVLGLAGTLGLSGTQAALTAEGTGAWLHAARGHVEEGALDAAVIDLKNALQADPDNAEARLLLGEVYVDLGQGAAAEKELRSARSLGTSYSDIVLSLGRALLLQRHFEDLLKGLDALDQPDDLAFEILLLRAQALTGARRPEEALDALGVAARLKPEDGRALLDQARILAAQGKRAEAAERVDAALSVAPELFEALLLKADLIRLRGEPQVSLEPYRSVLGQRPGSSRGHLGLAASLIALQRFDEAEAEIGQVLQAEPDHPLAHYLVAQIKVRTGDIGSAAAILKDSVVALEGYPPAQWLNGIVEYAQGRYETARVWLERYIDSAPGNLEARKLLAATLIRLNAPDDAIETLLPARELAPEDPQVMALLGGAYQQAGRSEEAVEQLASANRLAPQDARLLSNLALGHLATGDIARAEASFGAALDLGLERATVGHLIAMSHLAGGRFEQALVLARELQARFPESSLPHNLEGAAQVGLGDLAAARAALEEALRLEPGLVTARLNLAALDAREGALALAEAAYLDVLEDDEDNVAAMAGLAGIAEQRGRPEAALDWRRRAHEVDGTAVPPGLALAKTLAERGEFGEALAVVQRLRAGDPDRPALLEALGRLQAAQGEHDKAIASYVRLAEVTGGDPAARLRLAQAYSDGGEPARARAELESLLSARPGDAAAARALAGLVLEQEGPEPALALARRLAAADPGGTWGDLLSGDLLAQAGRGEEAITAYEAGWARQHSRALALALYRIRTADGQGEAALAPLQAWLAEAPEDAPLRQALAEALLRLGRHEAARAELRTLAAAGSAEPTVWNNLAWLEQEAGDPAALETAEHALALAPGRPAVLDTLAWILLDRGETGRAQALLQQAVTGAPDQPEIAYHYAVALHRGGRSEAAGVVLRELLRQARSFPSAEAAERLLAEVSGN